MMALLSALTFAVQLCGVAPDANTPIASLSLYNPTSWAGPSLVEVPTGRIAAPGLLDWTRVRLLVDKREIPFSLREGRAHWEATLKAPGTTPRPEDLLVFWCDVPPGEWVHVSLALSKPVQGSAITQTDDTLKITYPNVEATFDTSNGLLTSLCARGEVLLSSTMQASLHRLGPEGYSFAGNLRSGYFPYLVSMDEGDEVPVHARLVSSASTPAMTEVSFVLEGGEGPAMGLTYRIHASGLITIVADERPWTGTSPWQTHAMTFELPLEGTWDSLPYHEERLPFYGFKDFVGLIKPTARKGVVGDVGLLELGEEVVNGRRWQRHLFTFAAGNDKAALEMLDEGLVIEVNPLVTKMPEEPVNIVAPDEASVVAQLLKDALDEHGVAATLLSSPTIKSTITLSLDTGSAPDTLVEGGFSTGMRSGNTCVIHALNVFGLDQGVRALDRYLDTSDAGTFPLMAQNPVAPFRCLGPGGGEFEVDFPYGTDEEWQAAFDNLLDSGMNVFWCMGMWGNWKMPVSYKYMPALQSDEPDAFDQTTGVYLSEVATQRERGLKLMHYLQDRGARVGVWLPIGCVPTTFIDKFPDALLEGSITKFWGRPAATPCFTDPAYHQYMKALLHELIETYPLDGVVMCRDDNGTICTCERCQTFVKESRMKDAAWCQFIQIYDWLREFGFKGTIGVYPYGDGIKPELESQLPEDMWLVGHGASTAILTRQQDLIAHMPDTWLDNLYANFRLPSSPRLRRLLGGRNTFWLGGAYCGTELPLEAIGYFGSEPTATPNTFRYQWGKRTFGAENAEAFCALSDAYEDLWDINARYLLPLSWMRMTPDERDRVTHEAMASLGTFVARLDAFKAQVDTDAHALWLKHMNLWPVFFEYHLRRIGRFAEIHDLVRDNRDAMDGDDGLPKPISDTILEKYAEIYTWGEAYSRAEREVPGNMLTKTQPMTMPYKEWRAGYGHWLDGWLDCKQFDGTLNVEPLELTAGEPFTLQVELHNTGMCAWVAAAEQQLKLSGAAKMLGLPGQWKFDGAPMAPGDRRVVTFQGMAPAEPGSAELTLGFCAPYRGNPNCAENTVELTWK